MARWPDRLLMVGLFGLAAAARWPLLQVPPYGDEFIHVVRARLWTGLPANVSDVWGETWIHVPFIFWLRPFFFIVFRPFAAVDFTTFRVAHLLLTSLLPVVSYGLLRAHGARRLTCVLAGLFAATFPLLVTWGVLGLMDELMAVLFTGGLWARQRGRWLLAPALFVLAAWTKETAVAPLAAITAWSLLRGWVHGRVVFGPEVRLPQADGALLLACVLAPLPLLYTLMTGLDQWGGAASGYGDRLLETLTPSLWLLPVVVLGLLWPRSRPLAALALFLVAFNLALHVLLGRAVEVWYLVMPVLWCGLAAALAADEAWRRATPAGLAARSAAAGVALACIGLVAIATLAPASEAKAWATHPLTGQADESLMGMYRYETSARVDPLADPAIVRLGLDGSQRLVVVDVEYQDVLRLGERAAWVYADSAILRVLFHTDLEAFAQRAETDGTWLVVRHTDAPFYHAINEAYVDCRVDESGLYRVYEAWRCPGGLAKLDEGVRGRTP